MCLYRLHKVNLAYKAKFNHTQCFVSRIQKRNAKQCVVPPIPSRSVGLIFLSLKSLSDYGDYGDSTERSSPIPIQSYNQMRVQSDFEDRKRWILTHDFTSLNCYVRFYEMCAAILSLCAYVCQKSEHKI